MGNYVANVLEPKEIIVHETTLHWSIYIRAFLLCFVLVGFFLLPLAIIRKRIDEFVITSSRVISRRNYFAPVTQEMLLTEVKEVTVFWNFFGMPLNYGTVVILGKDGAKMVFPCVNSPYLFKNMLDRASKARRVHEAAVKTLMEE